MSSGSGTSFNQSYATIEGGVLPLPYPSNIEGDIGIFEKGIGAISTNYQPNLSSIKLTQGGKCVEQERKRGEKKCKNKSKRKYGSKKQKRNLKTKNKTIRPNRPKSTK